MAYLYDVCSLYQTPQRGAPRLQHPSMPGNLLHTERQAMSASLKPCACLRAVHEVVCYGTALFPGRPCMLAGMSTQAATHLSEP